MLDLARAKRQSQAKGATARESWRQWWVSICMASEDEDDVNTCAGIQVR